MRTATTLAIAVSLLVLSPRADGRPCETDRECGKGRVCRQGECMSANAARALDQKSEESTYDEEYGPLPEEEARDEEVEEDRTVASGPGYAPPRYAAAAPAPRPPSRSFFEAGYGKLSIFLGFHSWGGWTYTYTAPDIDEEDDGDLSGAFSGGLTLAGYGVISDYFHIGGYYGFSGGKVTQIDEDEDGDRSEHTGTAWRNALGVSLKGGAPLGPMVWLGASLDIGIAFYRWYPTEWAGESEGIKVSGEYEDEDIEEFREDYNTLFGLELHPAIEIDVMLVDTGALRFGLCASLGLGVIPVFGGDPYDDEDEDEYTGLTEDEWEEENDVTERTRDWLLTPVLTIGAMLGY